MLLKLQKFVVNPETLCWEWTGSTDEDGYGTIRRVDSAHLKAHRCSYEEYVGPVPDGLCVCHLCYNTCCINPSHLYAGTHQQNMLERNEKNCGHMFSVLPKLWQYPRCQQGHHTETVALRGVYKDQAQTRAEFLALTCG